MKMDIGFNEDFSGQFSEWQQEWEASQTVCETELGCYSNSDDQQSEDEMTEVKKAKLVSEDEVESVVIHPHSTAPQPTKKFTRKYQGAAAYKSKFQLQWQKKWPCITPMKEKPNYFYCTVCSKSVSCGHQGEKDVKRHMDSDFHKKNVSSVKHTVPLKFIPSNLKKKVVVD